MGVKYLSLYVQFPEEADAPIRQLKGFEVNLVTVRSTETMKFSVLRRDLNYWDVAAQQWG